MPVERGNYRFLAKCSTHDNKFKAVYFISTKEKALTTQVKFVQDFVMPLGLRLLYLRAHGGDEVIADYYSDCCKTPAILRQFNSPNTPEHHGLSEREGHTIVDVAGAALPKSLWGKMVTTAGFLLSRPPCKPIGGDTSYYMMFSKHVNLFVFRIIGTRPHGGRQAHLALTLPHIRFSHHLRRKHQLRAHRLLRRFIRHRRPGEDVVYIMERSMHVLSVGSSTSALASSATTKELCS